MLGAPLHTIWSNQRCPCLVQDENDIDVDSSSGDDIGQPSSRGRGRRGQRGRVSRPGRHEAMLASLTAQAAGINSAAADGIHPGMAGRGRGAASRARGNRGRSNGGTRGRAGTRGGGAGVMSAHSSRNDPVGPEPSNGADREQPSKDGGTMVATESEQQSAGTSASTVRAGAASCGSASHARGRGRGRTTGGRGHGRGSGRMSQTAAAAEDVLAAP